MTILCYLLAAALISVIGVSFWREKSHQAEREKHRLVCADLLDRVMARSYGEYIAGTKLNTAGQVLKRRGLSDEEMAELESKRVGVSGK